MATIGLMFPAAFGDILAAHDSLREEAALFSAHLDVISRSLQFQWTGHQYEYAEKSDASRPVYPHAQSVLVASELHSYTHIAVDVIGTPTSSILLHVSI